MLVLWASLAALYLLLAGQTSMNEGVAAAATALAGAALSGGVRWSSGEALHARPVSALRLVARAVAALPGDTLLVGARLMSPRPASGRMETKALRETGRTARGLEIMAISLTPSRFVTVLTNEDDVLVHRLGS